uniref:Uncharacterized protein n=1 Tax=Lepeophtheirus salmonis TaxID=72036 RepID=A0A0K2T2G8_LEPSM
MYYFAYIAPYNRGKTRYQPQLVPKNHITSIQFRFYTLRLTQSSLYSPQRVENWKEEVEEHMKSLNNKKMNMMKMGDCDSGYSDG